MTVTVTHTAWCGVTVTRTACTCGALLRATQTALTATTGAHATETTARQAAEADAARARTEAEAARQVAAQTEAALADWQRDYRALYDLWVEAGQQRDLLVAGLAEAAGWPDATYLHALQTGPALVRTLRAQLAAIAPWTCPTCGPHVKITEDGTCAACGADARRDHDD